MKMLTPLFHGPIASARAVGICFAVWLAIAHQAVIATGADDNSNVLAEFTIDGFNGIVVVPVTFHGVTYKFFVDTGSANTNFSPSMSAILVGPPREATLAGVAHTADAPVYRSPDGRVGPLRLAPLDNVSCAEQNANRFLPAKVAGTLGMDALRAFIIRVDYDGEKVSFLRRVPPDAGLRVPLNKATVCPTIKISVGELIGEFTLDTGCILYGAGSLAERDFNALTARRSVSVVDTLPSWTAFNIREHRVGILNIPVSVAGREHAALAFSEIGNVDLTTGILGSGYLRRYTVIFDFPHSAVYLAPGQNYLQIDASHDPGGLRLTRDGRRVLVSDVAWQCPASQAGVGEGDILIELDGKDASMLDDFALAKSLSRSDGPTTFTFRRPSNGSIIRFVHDEGALRQHVLGELKLSSQQRTSSRAQRPADRVKIGARKWLRWKK